MAVGDLASIYPIVGTADAWGEALRRIPQDCVWSEEAERYAVDRFAKAHALHTSERAQSISDAVNMFKARLLIRIKCGLPVDELIREYRPYEHMYFRESGFDRSLRLALGELEATDVPALIQTLGELLSFGREKTAT